MSRPNYGPRLRPNKAGVFSIHWTEKGRSKRVSTGTANLSEAQKVLAGFLLEQERQTEGPMTVGQVVDYYDVNHIAEAVIDKPRQRRALALVADAVGRDRFIDELASDDFVKYRQMRRKTRFRRKTTTDDATIRRELNTFAAAINFAIKNRKLENRHAPVINLPDHNPNKDRWLEKHEARTLLEIAQPAGAKRLTRIYRFTAIALSAPKRKQAIETLKWFQVDLKNRIIDFRRPGEPETKKRRGRCPISSWLLPILERAFAEKTSEYVLDKPQSITREFAAMRDAAKMYDVTPHTCRHTWGTWAAQGGMSLWAIAGMMGCSIRVATNNYLHHSPEHLRNVADQVSPEVANIVAPTTEENGAERWAE